MRVFHPGGHARTRFGGRQAGSRSAVRGRRLVRGAAARHTAGHRAPRRHRRGPVVDPPGATAARYAEAQPRYLAPHFTRASRARPRHLTAAAHRALAESAQPCAVIPSTTSRSPPTEIPLRMRCVRFLGLELGEVRDRRPEGLGRRTPGVVRVVQVCLRTGCSGGISVCGCFTWNMSASVSVPASCQFLRLSLHQLPCPSLARASGHQGVRPSGRQRRQRRQSGEISRQDLLSPGSDDASSVRTIAGRRNGRASRVGTSSARVGGRGGRRGPVLLGAGVGRQWRGGVGAPAAHAG